MQLLKDLFKNLALSTDRRENITLCGLRIVISTYIMNKRNTYTI